MFRTFVVTAFAALVGMTVIGCPAGQQTAPKGDPAPATSTYECAGCKAKVSYTPAKGSTGAVGQTADHKCPGCKAEMKKDIDFCAKCAKDEIFCAKCAAAGSGAASKKPAEKKGS